MNWRLVLIWVGTFLAINITLAAIFAGPNIFDLTVIFYNTVATITGIAGTGISWGWSGIKFIWDWVPFPINIIILAIIFFKFYGKYKKSIFVKPAVDKLWEWLGRFRKGSWQRFKQRHGRRAVDELKARTQRWAGKTDVLLKWERAEGYEPKSFLDNRILLFALMDYSLRLDIFHTKWYSVEYDITPKMKELSEKLKKFRIRRDVRRQINEFRSLEPQDIRNVRARPEEEEIPTFGWAVFDKILVTHMNRTIELMYIAMKVVKTVPEAEKQRYLIQIRGELIRIQNILNNISGAASKSHRQFSGRVEALGIMHKIRSRLLNVYDMQNPYGQYQHHYLFTKSGAVFREDPIDTESGTVPAPSGIEVDPFGLEVDKINLKDPNKPPRKLLNPRAQSEFLQNFLEMLECSNKEWRGFVSDFRRGMFSRRSRTIQDYADAFEQNIDVHLDDDAVEFKRQAGVAFDRRALVNPGLYKYWGRMKYDDVGERALPYSPYPRLTVIGIQSYLANLIESRERDYEAILNEFLSKYPMDTGDLIKTERQLIQAIRHYSRGQGEQTP